MKDKLIDFLIGPGGPLHVRALIALITTGTICYLFIAGESIPDSLAAAWGAVIGIYFTARLMQDK